MFSRMRYPALLIAVSGFAFSGTAPAHADATCAQAWYMRNLIAHHAGQCFKSNLGKGMFGNDKCFSEGVKLSKEDQKTISQFVQMEKDWQCKIDTSKSSIKVYDKTLIDRLERFSVRGEFESGCISYQEEDIPLHASPSKSSRIVGTLSKGMNAGSSYQEIGKWSFIEVSKEADYIAMGWINVGIFDDSCKHYAG